MFERHVTELPRPPHLVADAPIPDLERFRAPLRRPEPAHRRARGSIAVLELGRRRIGIAKTGVHRDPRLRLHQLAEPDEFVHPEIVVFDPGPGRVRPWADAGRGRPHRRASRSR
jgi:hypothetical protein